MSPASYNDDGSAGLPDADLAEIELSPVNGDNNINNDNDNNSDNDNNDNNRNRKSLQFTKAELGKACSDDSSMITIDEEPNSASITASELSISTTEGQRLMTGWRKQQLENSLPESYASVQCAASDAVWWRKLFPFLGLGIMISAGFMDPGNWATDIAGGASFGYDLLFVVLVSSFFSMLLQHLALKLGVATGRDLAQACRDAYPTWIVAIIWVAMEIAIAATDLAELLGCAIALQLLFNLPLAAGVAITSADVLLILLVQQKQIRLLEGLVAILTLGITSIFIFELTAAKPNYTDVMTGFVPTQQLFTNASELYLAISIIGATVMPHNLFLHSATIQTRNYERNNSGRAMAIKYATVDSTVSLSVAFFVNAFILILAAAAFHSEHSDVADISTAYLLLSPTLGAKAASVLFAVALLFSGQQASFTGTLAGQIVLEGLMTIKIKAWKRRVITRGAALLPALLVTLIYNSDAAVNNLLILSQVVLSITLSFATIPLLLLTSDAAKMGEFVNGWKMKIVAGLVVVVLTGLNIYLLTQPDTFALQNT